MVEGRGEGTKKKQQSRLGVELVGGGGSSGGGGGGGGGSSSSSRINCTHLGVFGFFGTVWTAAPRASQI